MNLLLLILALGTDPATMPEMMPELTPAPIVSATTAPEPEEMAATLPTSAPTSGPTSIPTSMPSSQPTSRSTATPGSYNRYSRWSRQRSSPSAVNVTASTKPTVFDPMNPRPYSPEFSLLLSRSMFVRGHMSVDTHRGGVDPSASNAPPQQPSTEPSLARPETTLVFNGVTVANGNPVAFIEDTANQRVLTVQVGQQIAQGKITDITLDTLAYRNSTRTVELHIGQDLSGNDAVASATTSPSSPTDLSSTGDSVLDRLRKKRLQELLGK